MFYYYIAIGILANFIWALHFLIPYLLTQINPIYIIFGRYFVYGILSLILVFKNSRSTLTVSQWRTAFVFSFVGNIGYYAVLCLAIKNLGIVIVTLIVGMLPITTTIYANFLKKEIEYSKLILPIILILIGILISSCVDLKVLFVSKSITHSIIGFIEAISALLFWTWYSVQNACYLKKHQEIANNVWSTAIGICCLIQILCFLIPISFLFDFNQLSLLLNNKTYIFHLIAGSVVLGVFVSWLATFIWSKISRVLPVTLLSQLLVFETIASVLYGFILTKPQLLAIVGVLITLTGIIISIRVTIVAKNDNKHASSKMKNINIL